MSKTYWQDPRSTEIRSTHISGLQEAVGKIEESIGIETKSEVDISLSEVFISNDDRCRIYQAPEGKRNWLSYPAPVIKKNGIVTTDDFEIDYGGGAVIFTTPILETDTIAVDVAYTLADSDIKNKIDIAQIKSSLTVSESGYVLDASQGKILNDKIESHLLDYVRQPGYAVTTGAANTYLANLTPAPAAYTDGMGIVVKINAANTGASTINVNGLGAKAVVDGKGNALTTGKLRLNGTYSLKYNTTSGNFILQGSDSSGNATPADLLAGKTASTDAGDIVGSMNNIGAGSRPATVTRTGNTLQFSPDIDGYINTSGKLISTDNDWIEANIVSGKSIFGKVGSFAGKRWASGTIVSSTTSIAFEYRGGGTATWYSITVSGLNFKPSFIMVQFVSIPFTYVTTYDEMGLDYPKSIKMFTTNTTVFNANIIHFKGDVASASVTSTGFVLPVNASNATYSWIAFE